MEDYYTLKGCLAISVQRTRLQTCGILLACVNPKLGRGMRGQLMGAGTRGFLVELGLPGVLQN
jgi:hypothetical protein